MPRPSPAKARSQMIDIIGASILQALELKESLQVERDALERQDADALVAVVKSKSACAEELQRLDRKRSALCHEWGFADGPDQMDLLLQWCDESRLIGDRWEELLDVASAGSALNLTNGAIIRVRQQQFESSLSVLRGVMPGSDTYGQNGEEAGDFSRHSLAEA